jgi:hypothetical protein
MRLSFARVLILLAAACVAGPSAAPARNKPAPGIAAVSWLAGSWRGAHDGGTIEEHWMPPSGRSMSGMARLVIGEKTAFFEFLRIVERDDGSVVYLAQPGGRCPAVEFTLTRCEVGVAVFENPAHDNPKVIRYELSDEGKTLTATTEGDDRGERRVHETVMTRSALTE